MEKLNNNYSPSGKFELIGIFYMILFGLFTSIVLGLGYSYLIYYIPFVYINFFITIGLGSFVGISVWYGCKFGKSRNVNLTLIISFFSGLIALYVSYITWVYIITNSIIYSPKGLYLFAKIVSYTGAYSIFGYTPTGFVAWTIWFIEALLIVVIPLFVVHTNLINTIFCEKCKKWATKKEIVSNLEFINDPSMLNEIINKSNFSHLLTLKTTKLPVFTQIELISCESCDKSRYINVNAVAMVKNKDGKLEEKSKELVNNAKIDLDIYKKLLIKKSTLENQPKK